jgi:Protein of unknown function (DUF3617)
MSPKKRNLILGLGVAGAVATALVVHAAQPALNIKVGLWETHTEVKMGGDVASMIPEEQLAKMTPEQKARMEAALQQSMAAMQKPHYAKECMTAEKIAKGFDLGDSKSGNCTNDITTNTASQYEAHVVCAGNAGKQAMTVHISADSPTHVVGTVTGDQSQGAMTYSGTFEGRWLSSECGAIKDRESEAGPSK